MMKSLNDMTLDGVNNAYQFVADVCSLQKVLEAVDREDDELLQYELYGVEIDHRHKKYGYIIKKWAIGKFYNSNMSTINNDGERTYLTAWLFDDLKEAYGFLTAQMFA